MTSQQQGGWLIEPFLSSALESSLRQVRRGCRDRSSSYVVADKDITFIICCPSPNLTSVNQLLAISPADGPYLDLICSFSDKRATHRRQKELDVLRPAHTCALTSSAGSQSSIFLLTEVSSVAGPPGRAGVGKVSYWWRELGLWVVGIGGKTRTSPTLFQNK